MAGNPLTKNAPFFKLTWGELETEMPFATDMQRYEAAQRISATLRNRFIDLAHDLGHEYAASDRERLERLREASGDR